MTEVRIPLRALVPMRTFYTIPPRYQELETKKKYHDVVMVVTKLVLAPV